MSADDAADRSRPVLRVVVGDATADEVAALVAVLVATAGPKESPPATVSRWGTAADAVRGVVRPGPDAWRTSAWPT